ncbi:MAG: M48 family metallopeptidase [Ktedonobacterales bacterium]|nr:M48 family metallopeptidase [Ktedonobacterales bacterium]
MPIIPRSPRPSTRAAPAVPPPRTLLITLGGTGVPYLLKTSARARRVRLVIRPATGLEVVVPCGVGAGDVEHVLREKAAWITATLARMAERVIAPPPLAEGRVLSYLGQPLRLALRGGAPPGKFRAVLGKGTLTLMVATPAEETVRAALEAWYRRQARAIFAECVERCNLAYGFSYARIAIKDQKSRWGSCSRKGNLNFNWRLLLAPSSVLEYVVYHELAHLREPNHSPRFWAVVERACPAYREHRRWLKQHGHELGF